MIPRYPDNLRVAVFAGSFDPFTKGHMSILSRGLTLFDRVLIVVGYNSAKQDSASDARERMDRIRRITAELPCVDVVEWDGLTVDIARQCGAGFLLRGVRSVSDFEYEKNMADINRKIAGIETVILIAEPDLAMVSSSMVRELQSHGYDISEFLPETTD